MAESKRLPIIVRPSFSHPRVKPFLVARRGEAARDAAPAIEKPALACPACGARMKFVHRAATIGAPATLVATCARCAGRGDA
jgi:hypothetical protein